MSAVCAPAPGTRGSARCSPSRTMVGPSGLLPRTLRALCYYPDCAVFVPNCCVHRLPRGMTPSDLVEREREIAALAELLDAPPAGEGRVAWIEGPAGIGK